MAWYHFTPMASMYDAYSALRNNATVAHIQTLTNPPNDALASTRLVGSPLYSYFSYYLNSEISMALTLALALTASASAALNIFWTRIWTVLGGAITSSVTVDEHDDLFDMVLAWITEHHQVVVPNRNMLASTTPPSATNQTELGDFDHEGVFNFNRWVAKMPPRLVSYYGRQIIRYNHRFFRVERKQLSRGTKMPGRQTRSGEINDAVRIACLGRSFEPIRQLLASVKQWNADNMQHTTTIRYATSRLPGRSGWSKITTRPVRPIDTVYLDHEQKEFVINDVQEFLHPSSPKWYAARGVPYRRGYLFHGPPGTGKTSLSFALAGIFGLEIYVVSLQEPNLTESDLMQLFNSLPKRCIVLFEDVDAVGLSRVSPKSRDVALDNGPARIKSLTQDQLVSLDIEATYKSAQSSTETATNQASKSNVSLSGFLNVVDGVAAHEGHILVMTTNHRRLLDPALTRPGRVDCQVEFVLATKNQARNIFIGMYAEDDDRQTQNHSPTKHKMAAKSSDMVKGSSAPSIKDVKELAIAFEAEVPEGVISPAEIQSFLMLHKDKPERACQGVKEWVRKTIMEKELTD